MSTRLDLSRCQTVPLRTRFYHSVHTYQRVCPWNRTGTHLLYLGFDSPEKGYIVVQDLKTGDELILGHTTTFDFHTAADQHWILNDEAVIYRSCGEDGKDCPTIAYLNQKHPPSALKWLAGCDVRDVRYEPLDCLSGEKALVERRPTAQREAAIERIHFRSEKIETLLTAEEALAALLPSLHESGMVYFFNHAVFNPTQDRLFFKLMKSPDGTNKHSTFCAFFVMKIETRGVRCFGNRISGHPCWMPDGRFILNIKSPRDGSDNRWLVLVDSETGEDQKLIDLPIEGPGHPSPSPDGEWIVTDAFTPDGEQSPIYMIHTSTGVAKEMIRLKHRFRPTQEYAPHLITRGQPHPVWSPCGAKLIVNSNHGGHHMGLLILEDFLGEYS